MNEGMMRFRVGVMVLATLLIGGILVLLFGELPQLVRSTRTIHVRFADAPGVTEATPVRKSGILIGRVRQVRFDEEGGVLVTAEINGDVPVYRNDRCRVGGSLLGDAELQFVRQPELAPDEPVREGDVIQGEVAPDPLQVLRDLAPTMERMMVSVTQTSQEVGQLAARLERLLAQNDEQLARLLDKTEQTLDSVRMAANSLDALVSDPALRQNLIASLENLPELLDESRQAIAGLQQTVELAERNLSNLERFTEPLGEQGGQFFARLDRTLAKSELLLDELTRFGTALNRPEGALGRLLTEPELYDNLNDAVTNINCLVRELRPVVHDVRVFTDKIARDPGRLGVRGVFQQPSGIK